MLPIRLVTPRGALAAALLLSVLVGLLAPAPRASAAGGPYLPDLALGDACRIQGPEGPPKLRFTVVNAGNDLAANRLAITVQGTQSGSVNSTILFPERWVTLEPGQSVTITIGFPAQYAAREVRVRLYFVSGGDRKLMEEHATSNNLLRFDYQSLPAC